MNRDMYMHKMDLVIPAALFVVLEGLSAAPAMAGDGVVILQREVPARPAYREGELGRASTIDTSPDDKVRQAVNGQQSGLHSIELGDAEFATVSTDAPQSMSAVVDQVSAVGLSSQHGLSGNGLNVSGNASGSVQSIASTVTGAVGSALGGAIGGTAGHTGSGIAGGITGATGTLGNLTGAIMRSSGQ